MKHVTALIIKFVMVAVILEVTFFILTNLNITEVLYLSALVTIVAYVLGDLIILPVSNNTIATIADMGLVVATIYFYNYLLRTTDIISFTDALVPAVIIGLGEWFFHRYVASSILGRPKQV